MYSPAPKAHLSNCSAVLYNGDQRVPLISTDVKQKQDVIPHDDEGKQFYTLGKIVIEGSLSFPLITGTENVLTDFFSNIAKDTPLPAWRMSYFDSDIKYQVEKVNRISLAVNSGNSIDVTVYVVCHKNINKEPLPSRDLPFSPQRVYTWNDAIVNLTLDRKVIIPGEWIRSASIQLERGADGVKATGTIVQLGESKVHFDPAKNYGVQIGYQREQGIFNTTTTINVDRIKVRETPGFADKSGPLYEMEEVNGVKIYREVPNSGILCTKFDWQTIIKV